MLNEYPALYLLYRSTNQSICAGKRTCRSMVAMRNATDSAKDLIRLQLEYNKVRQTNITNDMLDIAGGAEAFSPSVRKLRI